MTTAPMRHDAFVYESDYAFTSQMGPFLEEGLEAGESLVAVTSQRNREALQDHLGAAASAVAFIDRDTFYTRPLAALAAYDATLRRLVAAGAPAVRVVGELPQCATPAEWAPWIAYETIVSRAFAHYPVWAICAYGTELMPADVVNAGCAAHTRVLNRAWAQSDHDYDPAQAIQVLAPPPRPVGELRLVPVAADGVAFRDRLADALDDIGAPVERARDLILAAQEVHANAFRHGGGLRVLRIGQVADRIVCELTDAGPGLDDPLAGYLPPRPGATSGVGLWVARQLTWDLELIPAPGGGLVVRLWV